MTPDTQEGGSMSSGPSNGAAVEKTLDSAFDWHGSAISVESRISGRFLFLATEDRLVVDGKPVAETGGFRFTHEESGEFVGADGSTHEIHYRIGGAVWVTRIPFTVSIDGVEVYKGAVRPTGMLGLILVLILVGIGAGALVAALLG